MAMDAAFPAARPTPMGILTRLAKRCSPEEWAEFHRLLRGDEGAVDNDNPDTQADERDRPPAMDAAMRGLMGRELGRIAIDTTGIQPAPRPAVVKPAAAADFYTRFPEAKRTV
ncbi:hypothetical protein UAJ10_09275 [Nitrospirillum sp. BR 11164]|uniref:hypothetical protein n=1 Tax=Nitrospirillum sp. BR 11164 TaxID=3104324 RepID=UPI002B000E81|nr:hypothetical protein [Nitrospirillum sp. BR 11164]MEA1649208.1 hypothetical protein [Nitrospirillum sp. BR 11164]